MKLLTIFFFSTLSFNAFSSCEQFEAQVLTTVEQVSITQSDCLLKVSVIEINEHVFCPLTQEEIESSEVTLSLLENGNCPFNEEELLSGILVKSVNGKIALD